GVQVPGVPLLEDLGQLGGLDAGGAQDVVRLGDELHVGVLDAVVHHLDEVAGAVRADVDTARLTVVLGGDALQDRPEGLVGLGRAAGHDARPVERALLATGDAGADEVQADLAQRLLPAAGVLVVGVAAVDDDVALLQERDEGVDDRVGRTTGLDHDDHLAGALEAGDELLQRRARHYLALLAVGRDVLVCLGRRAVVQRHGVPVARKVPGDVAAHDGKPDDSDLR